MGGVGEWSRLQHESASFSVWQRPNVVHPKLDKNNPRWIPILAHSHAAARRNVAPSCY